MVWPLAKLVFVILLFDVVLFMYIAAIYVLVAAHGVRHTWFCSGHLQFYFSCFSSRRSLSWLCESFKKFNFLLFLFAIPKESQPISDFVCVSIACKICLCVTGFPKDHLMRKLLMTVKRSELNFFIDQSEMRIFVVDYNIALSGYERCTLALYTCKLVKIRTGLPIRQDFTERIWGLYWRQLFLDTIIEGTDVLRDLEHLCLNKNK